MASVANEPFTSFSAQIDAHGEDAFPWEGQITTANLLVLVNGGDTPDAERAAELAGAVATLRSRLEAGEIVCTSTATIYPRRN